MTKIFLKIFSVPKRSLGYTDHLYTYKGHTLMALIGNGAYSANLAKLM